MKKIYFKILVIILIIIGSFSVSFANEDEDADYNETKKSIDSYIDNQLEKIDLKEIQKYINDSSTIDDIDLKIFMKASMERSGEHRILLLWVTSISIILHRILIYWSIFPMLLPVRMPRF